MKENRDIFTYHTADNISITRFKEIRDSAKILHNKILINGENEQDIERAIEKLRECVFYAIASIAIPEVK